MDDRVQEASKDVSRAYRSPADILRRGELTPAQKIALLRQWEYDLRLDLVASEESMGDGQAHEPAADLLPEVRRCLEALGADDPNASAATKSG